jgi:SAM-dependent methyltransferase
MNVMQAGVLRAREYFRPDASASTPEPSPQYAAVLERMQAAQRIVDLGCGANPHPRAAVGVDAFREPLHRILGKGARLDAATFQRLGVPFVQADLASLPFRDKEFDFAYSHHVFEHLPDPKRACAEMCRVARAGAILTPSIFSEVAFGRPYHLWFVIARGPRLIFLEKTAFEDRPFGEHPELASGTGGYRATPKTNPFEMLLNDAGWYRGNEKMSRVTRLLRRYWYSHSWVTEVNFVWEGQFDCTVIRADGRIE